MTPRPKPGPLDRARQYLAAGRLLEADAQCDLVLQRRKNDVSALTLRGQIAVKAGRIADALATLDHLARLRPGDTGVDLIRARLLLSLGRDDEALALYEGLLERHPDLVGAIAGRAATLDHLGRVGDALASIEPLVAAGDEDAEVAMIYTALRSRRGEHDRAIEVARRNLETPAGPLIASGLRFALGSALEKAGRTEEAFEAYADANELIREPFDPAVVRDRVDRLIATCTRATLAGLPRAQGQGDQAELPILVIGMPRSGSTLVERVIAAHPAATGIGEDDVLWGLARSLGEQIGSIGIYPECIEDLEQTDVDRLGRTYLDHLGALAPGADRVVDKQLGNDEALGLASLITPGARVVHCVRDPLDNCLSCYAIALEPKRHPYATDLSAIGFVYRQRERLMRHWAEVLDLPILTVQYEAMVEDQEAVSRRLIDFCGLAWDDACLRFHESSRQSRTLSYDQVRRPIYRSAMGRAAAFERHLGPLRHALGQE